jgi:hypothetical protein
MLPRQGGLRTMGTMLRTCAMSLSLLGLLSTVACTPAKPDVPALNPELAYGLLHNDNKAQAWLTIVQKENPGCAYHVELPDQAAHPTELGLDHIVQCGTKPAPRNLNASVVFTYDKAAGRWVIARFLS